MGRDIFIDAEKREREGRRFKEVEQQMPRRVSVARAGGKGEVWNWGVRAARGAR